MAITNILEEQSVPLASVGRTNALGRKPGIIMNMNSQKVGFVPRECNAESEVSPVIAVARQ
jgi:hypothetical protein